MHGRTGHMVNSGLVAKNVVMCMHIVIESTNTKRMISKGRLQRIRLDSETLSIDEVTLKGHWKAFVETSLYEADILNEG